MHCGGPRSRFYSCRHARTQQHTLTNKQAHKHTLNTSTQAGTRRRTKAHDHTSAYTHACMPNISGDDTVCFSHTLFTPHLSLALPANARIHAHAYARARNPPHAQRTRRWRHASAQMRGCTDEQETRSAGCVLLSPLSDPLAASNSRRRSAHD